MHEKEKRIAFSHAHKHHNTRAECSDLLLRLARGAFARGCPLISLHDQLVFHLSRGNLMSLTASKIIQKEFADYIRKKISDNSTHDPEYYSVTPPMDTLGTTHISVLDEDGMAVSVTSSINFIFGSGEYSRKTGIILNNMLTDFCKETDQVQAGERPPSSTATMILRSKVTNHTVVIGGSGGTMITTGMTMALMNFLWFGKSLKDSIAAPVVTLIDKKELNFEPDFDKEVIVALRVLGHKIPIFQNAVNALSKKDGECIQAVSDARKLAKAAGY
ncbi:hypothetical protein AOLI_G00067300 [Acnodon oligacanthus]